VVDRVPDFAMAGCSTPPAIASIAIRGTGDGGRGLGVYRGPVAHIDLLNGLPGILGLLRFRPQTAKPLMELAEVLLHGDSTLTRGERELIAARVSKLNSCEFCFNAHGTQAALQLDGGWETVDAVIADADGAPLPQRLRVLLRIAAAVQTGGRNVTPELVDAAKATGATDTEIHDVVLIAAAFCMYNRYVDGLATWAPTEREQYMGPGHRILTQGYLG
jgi:uncharacterized peroxidase-related enzyme